MLDGCTKNNDGYWTDERIVEWANAQVVWNNECAQASDVPCKRCGEMLTKFDAQYNGGMCGRCYEDETEH